MTLGSFTSVVHLYNVAKRTDKISCNAYYSQSYDLLLPLILVRCRMCYIVSYSFSTRYAYVKKELHSATMQRGKTRKRQSVKSLYYLVLNASYIVPALILKLYIYIYTLDFYADSFKSSPRIFPYVTLDTNVHFLSETLFFNEILIVEYNCKIKIQFCSLNCKYIQTKRNC